MYIYRNLTSDCFSVKFRGKVIERFTSPVVVHAGFQVSAAGRAQVLSRGKKFVHAYVKTLTPQLTPFIESEWSGFKKREVTYNPRKNETFVFRDTGEVAPAGHVVLEYPKVYVLEEV